MNMSRMRAVGPFRVSATRAFRFAPETITGDVTGDVTGDASPASRQLAAIGAR
jgi:hypothetical protein